MKQTNVSISIASEITGVEVHTLRYWDKEFEASLSVTRSKGNHRLYTPSDIATIFKIKRLLRDEMFSLAGARRQLERERLAQARGAS